jgi:hypothetical protein
LPKWHLISGEDIAPPKLVFTMNFESSLILGSFFFIVSVKLLLKDYLEDLAVICLFLQIYIWAGITSLHACLSP